MVSEVVNGEEPRAMVNEMSPEERPNTDPLVQKTPPR